MSQEISLQEYRSARRTLKAREEKKGFRIHAIVYLCVNTVLVIVNLTLVPEFLWFFFPLAGWGIGLAMHYVFGLKRLGRNLEHEEARIENEVRRAQ